MGYPELYRGPLTLLTDLYQLTMACGYWKSGMYGHEAVFHLSFRKNPFGGGYALAGGLASVVDYLEGFRFEEGDLDYLASLTGNDGKRLFPRDFLDYLRKTGFACDIDAVPEGTAVFPHEPLVRVQGPLIQCQLLETPLLNLVNFPTLIATKAARVAHAAGGEPVLEFGLRRAQGIDGALSASRAAYLGGCAATSNVLAGKLFGIPVRGTHAHSWIMCFDDELEALRAYAAALPNNCVFLVDTYDTLAGVRKAIAVGRELATRGQRMIGVRIDSGDLAYLSVAARRLLDDAGFADAVIVASNDLDERIIASLREQGARIGVWGVGTKLATAYDQPALGGVYKLGAVRAPGESWKPRVKLSEQAVKVSTPGVLQVRRFSAGGEFKADMIFDETRPPAPVPVMVDPLDPTRRKRLGAELAGADLLVPVFRSGRRVYQVPALEQSRVRAQEQLAGFHAGIKRFTNPHQFPVGLEEGLWRLKNELIRERRAALEAAT